MSKMIDKINNLFVKDKFDSAFRNAMKKHNYIITSVTDDGVYSIKAGTAEFKISTKDARRAYENDGSQETFDKHIKSLEKLCEMKSRMVSFTNAQAFLRFVIMKDTEVKPHMLAADFAEGLKKVVVCTPDNIRVTFLSEEYTKRWAVPKEVLFSAADRNMCRILEKAKITEGMLIDKIKVLEFNVQAKRFASALIMCNDFHRIAEKYLGKKFLVVAPSAESFLVLENITADILENLGQVILKEYKNAEHPLTTDVLLFMPDSVKIVGDFSLQKNDA